MKKVKAYNLHIDTIDLVHQEAMRDSRTDSDWLNIYLSKNLASKSNLPKVKVKRFVKPTLSEVQIYCLERKNSVSPQQFLDHYESNGWMRGRAKIKDWKACVRTWEKNSTGRKNEPLFDDNSTDWVDQNHGVII